MASILQIIIVIIIIIKILTSLIIIIIIIIVIIIIQNTKYQEILDMFVSGKRRGGQRRWGGRKRWPQVLRFQTGMNMRQRDQKSKI